MSFDALIGGLLHPLLVPGHALALLALALLTGRQAGKLWPSAAFAAALAAGLMAITRGVVQTWAGDLLLAAAVLAGLLVALAAPLPGLAVALLAAAVGAALGLDSPPQAIALTAARATLIGTWLGACLVLVLVAAGTGRLARDWQRIGVRIVGSWIAASALLVLALRHARGLLL